MSRRFVPRFSVSAFPSRFYFSSPLTDAPAVRYFRALMKAMLSGWDHVATLQALRLPGSPLEAGSTGDGFEYAVRGAPQALDWMGFALWPKRMTRLCRSSTSLTSLTAWSTGKALPEHLGVSHAKAARHVRLRGPAGSRLA